MKGKYIIASGPVIIENGKLLVNRDDKDDRVIKKNLALSKDECFNFTNDNFDVDLFLGDKLAILIVRTKNNKKIIKFVNKYFKFKGEK